MVDYSEIPIPQQGCEFLWTATTRLKSMTTLKQTCVQFCLLVRLFTRTASLDPSIFGWRVDVLERHPLQLDECSNVCRRWKHFKICSASVRIRCFGIKSVCQIGCTSTAIPLDASSYTVACRAKRACWQRRNAGSVALGLTTN